MNIRVPSLQPGERSLPAELRTYRGANFAQRRLRKGMDGVTGNGLGCMTMDPEAGVLIDDGTGPCGGGAITPDTLPLSTIPQTGDSTSPFFNMFGITSPSSTPTTAIPGGSASSMSPAQIAAIIAAGGNAATAMIRNATGPYLVPGTAMVYNPNNGVLQGGTGVLPLSALNTLTPLTGFSSTTLLMIGAAVVGFMWLSGRGK